ncbi:uncharacterized protein LOC135692938 isoform X1 [Rhopilema esculentum]|uniref:uncharacterized protein LOC135692938 isoform X1 n=1 Tax=Rhopilema esculentum TaxID=499914 RepID=UPI0031E0A0C0
MSYSINNESNVCDNSIWQLHRIVRSFLIAREDSIVQVIFVVNSSQGGRIWIGSGCSSQVCTVSLRLLRISCSKNQKSAQSTRKPSVQTNAAMRRIKIRSFDISELLLVLLILLAVTLETTGRMVCKNNLMCVTQNRDSCCKSTGGSYGVCSPLIPLGKKCQKNVRRKYLIDGFALSSCACERGLTCTRVIKKRKNKKKGKKSYRIKYKCLPIRKEVPEVAEFHPWS